MEDRLRITISQSVYPSHLKNGSLSSNILPEIFLGRGFIKWI